MYLPRAHELLLFYIFVKVLVPFFLSIYWVWCQSLNSQGTRWQGHELSKTSLQVIHHFYQARRLVSDKATCTLLEAEKVVLKFPIFPLDYCRVCGRGKGKIESSCIRVILINLAPHLPVRHRLQYVVQTLVRIIVLKWKPLVATNCSLPILVCTHHFGTWLCKYWTSNVQYLSFLGLCKCSLLLSKSQPKSLHHKNKANRSKKDVSLLKSKASGREIVMMLILIYRGPDNCLCACVLGTQNIHQKYLSLWMFIQQVKMFGERIYRASMLCQSFGLYFFSALDLYEMILKFCFVLGKFDTNSALSCLSLNAIAVISSFYLHPSTFVNEKHSSSIIMPDLFIRGQGWLRTMYSTAFSPPPGTWIVTQSVADLVFILFSRWKAPYKWCDACHLCCYNSATSTNSQQYSIRAYKKVAIYVGKCKVCDWVRFNFNTVILVVTNTYYKYTYWSFNFVGLLIFIPNRVKYILIMVGILASEFNLLF